MHGYGYGQDEDQGQLGAWYVMTAMGLFDVQGHTSERPSFQFGSPIFDKVSIELNNKYYKGRQLIISTQNQQPNNSYIQSVSWNKEAITNNWIYRDVLMDGGELNFVMGPAPNKDWGLHSVPPSMTIPKN